MEIIVWTMNDVLVSSDDWMRVVWSSLYRVMSFRLWMPAQVKILRRKLDDMERSYDVLLDEVKQMRVRVEGRDSHGSQTASGDSDKTHDETIEASRRHVSSWEIRARRVNESVMTPCAYRGLLINKLENYSLNGPSVEGFKHRLWEKYRSVLMHVKSSRRRLLILLLVLAYCSFHFSETHRLIVTV